MKEKILNKKLIFNILKLIALIAVVSVLFLSILFIFNIVSLEDGFHFNAHLFDSFKNKWYGWCFMIFFRVVVSIVFCFIPGISISLGILISTMYQNPIHAMIIWSIGVYISSVIMYFVGKFGGYKVCEKMLGKEDCEKAFRILREKGSVYFPITMMLPVFPDDALVMIAGTAKMNLPWFLASVIIGRGIGVITVVSGVSIVPFESFTCLYDWLVFITGCLFWIILVFKCAGKMNHVLEHMRIKKFAKLELEMDHIVCEENKNSEIKTVSSNDEKTNTANFIETPVLSNTISETVEDNNSTTENK